MSRLDQTFQSQENYCQGDNQLGIQNEMEQLMGRLTHMRGGSRCIHLHNDAHCAAQAVSMPLPWLLFFFPTNLLVQEFAPIENMYET